MASVPYTSVDEVSRFPQRILCGVKNIICLGANSMIMSAARYIHKLGGLSVSDSLNEILDMLLGIYVERRGDLAVYVVKNKNVNDGCARVYNKRKLIFGLVCGMAYLKHALDEGGAVHYVSVMSGNYIISLTLEYRNILNDYLTGNAES